MLENKYCAEFSYDRMLPKAAQEMIKEAKRKELAAEVISLLDEGKFHAIAVDYFEKPVCRDVHDFAAGMPTQMIRAKWTITVKPVKTVIVEVPKIEPPHYNLPATDSLKERATAAWNYLRGKGERG